MTTTKSTKSVESIFIALSPLQLLFCYEAKLHYGLKNDVILLPVDRESRGGKAIKKLLERQSWTNVYFISHKHKLSTLRPALNRLKSILTATSVTLVHSEPTHIYARAILGQFTVTREILVDDGTASFVEIPKIYQEQYVQKYSFNWKAALFLLQGIQLPRELKYDHVEFFSIFQKEFSQYPKVVFNDMSALMASLIDSEQGKKGEPEIAFIGQPFVSSNGIKEANYLAYIQHAKRDNPGHKLRYFPHRCEDPNFLDRLSKMEGIEVNQSPLPLEVELSQHPTIVHMYSIASTTMFTLPKIYPNLVIHRVVTQADDYIQPHWFEGITNVEHRLEAFNTLKR
ncbi:polysialyltransferase family glycosyltransferase [Vibrio sp. McD22-P3]|uniref:polysialyltransferase family glycosyltransferase n=1 Tax=Vibrio sp. McD22-P3 TaxID=2724880 RepID=UPI001F3F7CBA|nr:polysialyltransferase family glycosyltransferase [Vibrio sp. McD22-P3]MCF4175283.1 hypothetical protein [Vibrio sp. McD22-P3]